MLPLSTDDSTVDVNVGVDVETNADKPLLGFVVCVRALMTFPKALRLLLMNLASLS